MSDFLLVPTSALGIEGDLRASGDRYLETDGLETAIRLSLFTDRRALEGDELPEGIGAFGEDLRGYWADPYLSSGPMGSRLWTLKRSKLTRETRQRAVDFCLEALDWMVSLGIVSEFDIETEVASQGVLMIAVSPKREAATPARYAYLWSV